MFPSDLGNPRELRVDFGVRAFDFDDQQSLAIRITRAREGFGRTNTGAVHEFDGHRQDARFDNVAHASPCDRIVVKPNQRRPRAFGFWQDAQRGFGDNAKLAFGSTNDPQKVQTRGIHMRPADLDDFTFHRHQCDAQKVVRGDAVLKTMRATRVHGDIAGNRASQLRRGIWRIKEAVFLYRSRDAKIGTTRLNADEPVGIVCFQNIRQPRHTQHDTVRGRHRPTRQGRACPARHNGDIHLVTHLQRRGDLLCCLRQNHRQWRAAVGGQRITFISTRLFRRVDHAAFRQNGLQRSHDLGLARQNKRIWGG